MAKAVIGYIFYHSRGLDKEDTEFIELAKEKNIDLVKIDLTKEVDENELFEKVKKCDIVYNNSIQGFPVEIVKTIESFGKKVIDESKSYYYIQDKWILFVKCKEKKIPVPETILLSPRENILRKELKEFNQWPVILKKIDGTLGQGILKADNIKEAISIVKKLWKNERFPIIAQEFIKSSSYRVTIVGGKIVQTALKENKDWKCTGVYAKNIKKFKVDGELKKIINKLMKIVDIKICGIDLLKKDGKWIVLEVNSEPAFDFFDNEEKKLVSIVLNFLKKEAIKIKNK